MNRSKIEWCDHTLNILTGCNHGCPYCYARTMTQRFSGNIKRHLTLTDQYRKENGIYVLDEPFLDEAGQQVIYPFGFAPTYHRYRIGTVLDKLKMGQNIFVGAMADVFGEWVPKDIIDEIMEDCLNHPKNNYIFLTKNPERYRDICLPDKENYFYGTSVTRADEIIRMMMPMTGKHFVSFEPLLEDIAPALRGPWSYELFSGLDWIIIGAETGRRKDKVTPRREWIDQIVEMADALEIPVFMKDSLTSIVGEENMRRDFPMQLRKRPLSDKVFIRRNDSCLVCGKVLPKNKMITLSARAGKGGDYARLGFVCRECFGDWCEKNHLEAPELEGRYE